VGVGIFLGVHVAVPWLVARGVPLLFAVTAALYLPLAAGFAAALAAYRRTAGSWAWPAFRDRFRLRWPSHREWAIFVGGAILVLALETLLEPVSVWLATTLPLPRPPVLPPLLDPLTPVDLPPSAFVGTPLRGTAWIVPFWTAALVVNIGGEELLWRGYVLPRQEAVFGRWAWLVNGLLWAVLVHAFMWWTLVGLLPTSLVTPYLAQRYETTWAGVVVHGLGNAIWVVVLAAGVVGA
jgi:membrane protease YdiL (CAAX protease family)